MRMLRWAFIAAAMSFGLAAEATAQGLPSDVEQKLGIPRNSANPGGPLYGRFGHGGYRGHKLPSDVEQRLGIPRNSANPGGPLYDRRFGYREHREHRGSWAYADGRLARCQWRAHRRGLDGWEFRRFMRYCMDR